jgi:hypothetical protein
VEIFHNKFPFNPLKAEILPNVVVPLAWKTVSFDIVGVELLYVRPGLLQVTGLLTPLKKILSQVKV